MLPTESTLRARPSAAREIAAFGIALAAGVAALALMVGATYGMRSLQLRFTPDPFAPLPLALVPALPVLDADTYVHGHALFNATCAMCHGQKGLGMPGLGKDLTRSSFIADREDHQLISFIKVGRPATDPLNTTRVPMPPLGGNAALTDADLQKIVVYMRGLQDPRRKPDVPDELPAMSVAVAPPSDDEKAAALEAAGGDAELAEWIAHGTKLFGASCAACHGKDAKGMPGLGKDLTTSTFAAGLDDDALLDFLLKGRDPGDPLNTTKVGMPPKGGNPALSEDDLLDIIAYLRTLEKPKAIAP